MGTRMNTLQPSPVYTINQLKKNKKNKKQTKVLIQLQTRNQTAWVRPFTLVLASDKSGSMIFAIFKPFNKWQLMSNVIYKMQDFLV